ncbi:MFS transporter [Egicoccus halophilus]|uniref:MFS transporter n=1 Tax=Egicoccus halophilus TaxID=1670830 RepID=A0A8J3A539_9ACTN|nr:MFS transporter [Egicoccus halophilus]GGI02356.1 MFS transporter [Egicoccus halophilus]
MGRRDTPMRNANFLLYFAGVVFSEIGVRGTLAINLYHVYLLTESSLFVGLVGLFQFLAVITLGPLGGALADRIDRRRLVQVMQAGSFVTSAGLALVTWLGVVEPWHIYLAVLLNATAAAFDNPARRALIPNLVPRHQLVQAFALVTPARELSFMIGPALGGILVAVHGPELMYAFDALSYLFLIVALAVLRLKPGDKPTTRAPFIRSVGAGFSYVRRRPIIGQLLGLDVIATLFGAYRAILPELAEDVLQAGATGYGLLSAAVPAGALLGSWFVYRNIQHLHGGRLVLWSVAGYGLACVALAQAPILWLALAAAAAIGAMDAMGSTVRQAAIQVEIPDDIRGRITAIQQIATRGGPSLGILNVGAVAGVIGPVLALSIGGLVPVAVAGLAARASRTLRAYDVPTSEAEG